MWSTLPAHGTPGVLPGTQLSDQLPPGALCLDDLLPSGQDGEGELAPQGGEGEYVLAQGGGGERGVEVVLRRGGIDESWGFALEGGVEQGFPLTVQRVFPRSVADVHQLMRGDVITAVEGRATASLTHSQALQLVKRAGLDLTLNLDPQPAQPIPTRQVRMAPHRSAAQPPADYLHDPRAPQAAAPARLDPPSAIRSSSADPSPGGRRPYVPPQRGGQSALPTGLTEPGWAPRTKVLSGGARSVSHSTLVEPGWGARPSGAVARSAAHLPLTEMGWTPRGGHRSQAQTTRHAAQYVSNPTLYGEEEDHEGGGGWTAGTSQRSTLSRSSYDLTTESSTASAFAPSLWYQQQQTQQHQQQQQRGEQQQWHDQQEQLYQEKLQPNHQQQQLYQKQQQEPQLQQQYPYQHQPQHVQQTWRDPRERVTSQQQAGRSRDAQRTWQPNGGGLNSTEGAPAWYGSLRAAGSRHGWETSAQGPSRRAGDQEDPGWVPHGLDRETRWVEAQTTANTLPAPRTYRNEPANQGAVHGLQEGVAKKHHRVAEGGAKPQRFRSEIQDIHLVNTTWTVHDPSVRQSKQFHDVVTPTALQASPTIQALPPALQAPAFITGQATRQPFLRIGQQTVGDQKFGVVVPKSEYTALVNPPSQPAYAPSEMLPQLYQQDIVQPSINQPDQHADEMNLTGEAHFDQISQEVVVNRSNVINESDVINEIFDENIVTLIALPAASTTQQQGLTGAAEAQGSTVADEEMLETPVTPVMEALPTEPPAVVTLQAVEKPITLFEETMNEEQAGVVGNAVEVTAAPRAMDGKSQELEVIANDGLVEASAKPYAAAPVVADVCEARSEVVTLIETEAKTVDSAIVIVDQVQAKPAAGEGHAATSSDISSAVAIDTFTVSEIQVSASPVSLESATTSGDAEAKLIVAEATAQASAEGLSNKDGTESIAASVTDLPPSSTAIIVEETLKVDAVPTIEIPESSYTTVVPSAGAPTEPIVLLAEQPVGTRSEAASTASAQLIVPSDEQTKVEAQSDVVVPDKDIVPPNDTATKVVEESAVHNAGEIQESTKKDEAELSEAATPKIAEEHNDAIANVSEISGDAPNVPDATKDTKVQEVQKDVTIKQPQANVIDKTEAAEGSNDTKTKISDATKGAKTKAVEATKDDTKKMDSKKPAEVSKDVKAKVPEATKDSKAKPAESDKTKAKEANAKTKAEEVVSDSKTKALETPKNAKEKVAEPPRDSKTKVTEDTKTKESGKDDKVKTKVADTVKDAAKKATEGPKTDTKTTTPEAPKDSKSKVAETSKDAKAKVEEPAKPGQAKVNKLSTPSAFANKASSNKEMPGKLKPK